MQKELGLAVRVPHSDWEDGTLFTDLLIEAQQHGELYYILYWLRDVGTVLEKDAKFNYKLVPIIGAYGLDYCWSSQEEYDKEKQALLPYMKQLLECLRRIK